MDQVQLTFETTEQKYIEGFRRKCKNFAEQVCKAIHAESDMLRRMEMCDVRNTASSILSWVLEKGDFLHIPTLEKNQRPPTYIAPRVATTDGYIYYFDKNNQEFFKTEIFNDAHERYI